MEKRYNTLSDYYKSKYNSKVAKISLDASFTCPNKDGSKSFGGCIFCTSTPYIGDRKDSLEEQFYKVKSMMDNKWDNLKYIIYLEANSNTYKSVNELKEIYEPLIKYENVIGLNIGTRCDCISDEVLNYLKDLNKRTNLTIELGLQSSHDRSLQYLNRGHSKDEFTSCVKRLKDANIEVVVHIINGIPIEEKDDMIETIKYVNSLNIDGIKIHMLYLEKGSKISEMYLKEKFHILSKDEYIDIVCTQLRYLNKNVIVHRITSDPDKNKVIEPIWLLKKFCVLNDIDKYMNKNNIYQGDLL